MKAQFSTFWLKLTKHLCLISLLFQAWLYFCSSLTLMMTAGRKSFQGIFNPSPLSKILQICHYLLKLAKIWWNTFDGSHYQSKLDSTSAPLWRWWWQQEENLSEGFSIHLHLGKIWRDTLDGVKWCQRRKKLKKGPKVEQKATKKAEPEVVITNHSFFHISE